MAGRSLQFSRFFSSTRKLQTSMAEPLKEAAQNPHHATMIFWRNLFFFACIPALGLSMINVMLMEPVQRPPFVKYDHLRIRNTKYPWRDGVKTLFHNPHMNALPDGYEDEGHH